MLRLLMGFIFLSAPFLNGMDGWWITSDKPNQDKWANSRRKVQIIRSSNENNNSQSSSESSTANNSAQQQSSGAPDNNNSATNNNNVIDLSLESHQKLFRASKNNDSHHIFIGPTKIIVIKIFRQNELIGSKYFNDFESFRNSGLFEKTMIDAYVSPEMRLSFSKYHKHVPKLSSVVPKSSQPSVDNISPSPETKTTLPENVIADKAQSLTGNSSNASKSTGSSLTEMVSDVPTDFCVNPALIESELSHPSNVFMQQYNEMAKKSAHDVLQKMIANAPASSPQATIPEPNQPQSVLQPTQASFVGWIFQNEIVRGIGDQVLSTIIQSAVRYGLDQTKNYITHLWSNYRSRHPSTSQLPHTQVAASSNIPQSTFNADQQAAQLKIDDLIRSADALPSDHNVHVSDMKDYISCVNSYAQEANNEQHQRLTEGLIDLSHDLIDFTHGIGHGAVAQVANAVLHPLQTLREMTLGVFDGLHKVKRFVIITQRPMDGRVESYYQSMREIEEISRRYASKFSELYKTFSTLDSYEQGQFISRFLADIFVQKKVIAFSMSCFDFAQEAIKVGSLESTIARRMKATLGKMETIRQDAQGIIAPETKIASNGSIIPKEIPVPQLPQGTTGALGNLFEHHPDFQELIKHYGHDLVDEGIRHHEIVVASEVGASQVMQYCRSKWSPIITTDVWPPPLTTADGARTVIQQLVSNNSSDIWKNILVTNEGFYVDSLIPRNFVITVNGQKFWVSPSATKHFYELIVKNKTKDFIGTFNVNGVQTRIVQEYLLNDFYSAIQEALEKGIVYDKRGLVFGNWELQFLPAENVNHHPKIMHAKSNLLMNRNNRRLDA